jgi:thymidylate synthase (FAD)
MNLISMVKLSHVSSIPGMTPEQSVLHYARVSNPENPGPSQVLDAARDKKLLNYLIKHKHWSPFEMVSMCLEIHTTRDISRQMLRHRSFSFQEFSTRYSTNLESGDPYYSAPRFQDLNNRQNSIHLTDNSPDDQKLMDEWYRKQIEVNQVSSRAYKWALDRGLAKEVARGVLPEGQTKTRLFMHGTLRSWMHYVDIRASPETQYEHRKIAEEVKAIIYSDEVMPNAWTSSSVG